jgi:hypothetical protein
VVDEDQTKGSPSWAGRGAFSRKHVMLKRTDQLNALVRDLVRTYHSENGLALDKRKLRRRTKQLMVEIESGLAEIPISAVQKTNV